MKHCRTEQKHGHSSSEWTVFREQDRKWVEISKIILES